MDYLLTPQEIVSSLDAKVFGQTEAKKTIATALAEHYGFLQQGIDPQEVEYQKPNVLFIGDSGSGKTYLAKTAAKILDVPIAIEDATQLTSSGYVGRDVEDMFHSLYERSGYTAALAEKGIVFLDEVDKIAAAGIDRDVSGEDVQYELLRYVEGAEIHIQVGRKSERQTQCLDTSGIFFIFAGAFEGIQKDKPALGFGGNHVEYDLEQALRKYGMKKQLTARIPNVSFLHPLSQEDLFGILQLPKSPVLYSKVKSWESFNIDLVVCDSAKAYIAKKAAETAFNGRGLAKVTNTLFSPLFYGLTEKNYQGRVVVDDRVLADPQSYLQTISPQRPAIRVSPNVYEDSRLYIDAVKELRLARDVIQPALDYGFREKIPPQNLAGEINGLYCQIARRINRIKQDSGIDVGINKKDKHEIVVSYLDGEYNSIEDTVLDFIEQRRPHLDLFER